MEDFKRFSKKKKKQEETKFTTVYWLKQSAAKDVWLPNVKDLNVQLSNVTSK